MEELLNDILIGYKVREIFDNFNQNGISVDSNEFPFMLNQISDEFNVELEDISYYFESAMNILDEDDYIDP